ncbi:suppressor of hydroxyurea sensitivity [Maudiozyma exigua]|uniref:Suppressor of hydroxyurea sensitivity n=1 Tax=Maudiozyma exigua TaxID=34358 RepID=A0A9P7B8V1_MAUEX|nr:suppressor of hydroxyurea sensitivity [Kazachstania exigua]
MGQSVNYSELFSQLIAKDDKINTSMLTFLYYMFPRDLFIRALSLLESNDMMIYILDNENSPDTAAKRTETLADESISKSETNEIDTKVHAETINTQTNNELKYMNDTLRSIYKDDDFKLLYRLIVKSNDTTPIYVYLKNWTCSCNEYCELFHDSISSNRTESIQNKLITEIDDIDEFKDDHFAQLDIHSFSRQYYFQFDKVMCPHLLAYSILLRSSLTVLEHFVIRKSNVLLIRINNIDEWLKLHINIVV